MILSRLFTMPLMNAIISVGTAATSSGMHLIIPSISANRRSMPIWMMLGSSTMIAASKLPIIRGTAAISCGIASIRPCASVVISKIAVSMSCVKKSGLVSICTIVMVTCTMPSIRVGRFSIRAFARKKRMSIAACVIAGRLSIIPCPNAPTSATAACKVVCDGCYDHRNNSGRCRCNKLRNAAQDDTNARDDVLSSCNKAINEIACQGFEVRIFVSDAGYQV